jgi:hypothetical protein
MVIQERLSVGKPRVWNAIQWLHNFTVVKFMLGNSPYIFST